MVQSGFWHCCAYTVKPYFSDSNVCGNMIQKGDTMEKCGHVNNGCRHRTFLAMPSSPDIDDGPNPIGTFAREWTFPK